MKAIKTGFAVSWMRASGMLYPEANRIYNDPFSEKMVGGIYKILLHFMHNPRTFSKIMNSIEESSKGAIGSHFCRYRYIDDFLTKALNEQRIKTVINLGSGMDARAYFIPGVDIISYYELDHPSVIKVKKKKVRKALGHLPDNIKYVPIDFNQDNLDNVLKNSGYVPTSQTLFICEGVLSYLSQEVVDGLLRYISSVKDSELVFSYTIQSFLDGTNIQEGLHTVYKRFVQTGLLKSGIDPDHIKEYLSRFFFHLLEDIGAEEYKVRYMNSSGLNLDVNEIERIAYVKTSI